MELLHDRNEVFRRLGQLALAATLVHCVLAGRAGQAATETDLPELLATGNARLLADPQLAANPRLAELGTRRQVEVRVHAGPLRPMLIFDDRCACVPLDQAELTTGALLLRAPLVAPYGQLFDLMWSAASPLGDRPGWQDGLVSRLSARELEVAHLLVHGATDHQVANRLGVSSRTVRNVVAELHRRFGTTSRMALGFRLGAALEPADPEPAGSAPTGSARATLGHATPD